MYRTTNRKGTVAGRNDCLVRVESTFSDAVVDDYQILPKYGATPKGQVPYFGVTHLPAGQSNCRSGRLEHSDRIR